MSLWLILSMSLTSSLAFILQRLVLWAWVLQGVCYAVSFAFVSGFFITYLPPFLIRFILWLFLAFILNLSWILKRVPTLQNKGFSVFSSLTGLCAGLTGLGGGVILGSFLHESQKMPVQNIPAVIACIMLFSSFFGFIGQVSRIGFSFENLVLFYFLLLFIPAFMGMGLGYFMNIKQKNPLLRRIFLRAIVALMFAKLTMELYF